MSGWIEEVLPAKDGQPFFRIEHLGGAPWNEAPVPRRWHKCSPQTRAWHGASRVLRCACGGIAIDDRVFGERNQRSRRA